MPDDLYERDLVLWSERQSALLRRAATGERVNDLDWPHIIEEIEDVGGAAIRATKSLIGRAIEHLLKLHGWPGHPAAEHWRGETRTFLRDARDAFSPSMRQLLDLDRLFARVRHDVAALRVDGRPPAALPAANPFTLDDLLADRPDLDALLARLRDAEQAAGDA